MNIWRLLWPRRRLRVILAAPQMGGDARPAFFGRTPWDATWPHTDLPPRPPLSPPGAYMCPPDGELRTAEGLWTFGPGMLGRPDGIYLNGQPSLTFVPIAQGYVYTLDFWAWDAAGDWWLYNPSGGDWVQSSGGPPVKPPPCP